MFYTFFDKTSTGSGVTTLANKSAFNNEQLARELYGPRINFCLKKTVYSAFRDNIWGTDLADMQSKKQP